MQDHLQRPRTPKAPVALRSAGVGDHLREAGLRRRVLHQRARVLLRGHPRRAGDHGADPVPDRRGPQEALQNALKILNLVKPLHKMLQTH